MNSIASCWKVDKTRVLDQDRGGCDEMFMEKVRMLDNILSILGVSNPFSLLFNFLGERLIFCGNVLYICWCNRWRRFHIRRIHFRGTGQSWLSSILRWNNAISRDYFTFVPVKVQEEALVGYCASAGNELLKWKAYLIFYVIFGFTGQLQTEL